MSRPLCLAVWALTLIACDPSEQRAACPSGTMPAGEGCVANGSVPNDPRSDGGAPLPTSVETDGGVRRDDASTEQAEDASVIEVDAWVEPEPEPMETPDCPAGEDGAPHVAGVSEGGCDEVIAGLVYAAPGADPDAGDGSPENPFQFMSAAIAEADRRNTSVVASTGTFEESEPTIYASRVRVYGGYDPEDWSRIDEMTEWHTGPRGVLIEGLTQHSWLDRVAVRAASPASDPRGESTAALRVAGSIRAQLTLRDGKVSAGAGTRGDDGRAGADGSDGRQGAEGCPGRPNCPTDGVSVEMGTREVPNAGADGARGADGDVGLHGEGGSLLGVFSSDAIYTPPQAPSGLTGLEGATGQTGFANYYGRVTFRCPTRRDHMPAPPTGGRGGSGGTGGRGGGGGWGGGASVGVLVSDVLLEVVNTRITTLGGGPGGGGAAGGDGGRGGAGGSGGPEQCGHGRIGGDVAHHYRAPAAGDGGGGGTGGRGGDGGGGIGGPSFGVVLLRGARIRQGQGAELDPGPGGSGGNGAHQSNDGQPGPSEPVFIQR